jgi:predicted RNase H-like HicB family nuclease
MVFKISDSMNAEDYEILIRKRGEDDYASYCPQLNLMIKGTVHEDVKQQMKEKIEEHIEKLKAEAENKDE